MSAALVSVAHAIIVLINLSLSSSVSISVLLLTSPGEEVQYSRCRSLPNFESVKHLENFVSAGLWVVGVSASAPDTGRGPQGGPSTRPWMLSPVVLSVVGDTWGLQCCPRGFGSWLVIVPLRRCLCSPSLSSVSCGFLEPARARWQHCFDLVLGQRVLVCSWI